MYPFSRLFQTCNKWLCASIDVEAGINKIHFSKKKSREVQIYVETNPSNSCIFDVLIAGTSKLKVHVWRMCCKMKKKNGRSINHLQFLIEGRYTLLQKRRLEPAPDSDLRRLNSPSLRGGQ